MLEVYGEKPKYTIVISLSLTRLLQSLIQFENTDVENILISNNSGDIWSAKVFYKEK